STPQSPRSRCSKKTPGTFLLKPHPPARTTSLPARPDTRGNKGWRRESVSQPAPESSSRSADARAPAHSPPNQKQSRDSAGRRGRKETRPSPASTQRDTGYKSPANNAALTLRSAQMFS